MEIEILHMVEGARKAKGLTVVIDVFRAFSVACYAYSKGVTTIIPVGDIKLAYHLKKQFPDYILVGERNEQRPEGFDFGNSPSQLLAGEIEGKGMIHTTSSGTQGLVNAINADEILTGSFVNAQAITSYIKMINPKNVSLVCMGYASQYPVEEDTFCAEYIKAQLLEEEFDFNAKKEIIRQTSGARFFSPEKQEWAPSSDFDLCLDLNKFNFILKAMKNEPYTPLVRIDIMDSLDLSS